MSMGTEPNIRTKQPLNTTNRTLISFLSFSEEDKVRYWDM